MTPGLIVQIYENVGVGLPPQVLPTFLNVLDPAHIPHKEWASPEERQNYLTIERWSQLLHADPTTTASLHIPHKDWSNAEERGNYEEIERWARYFQTHCIAGEGEGAASAPLPDGTQWPGIYQAGSATYIEETQAGDPSSMGWIVDPGHPAYTDGEMFTYLVVRAGDIGGSVSGFLNDAYKVFDATSGGTRFRLYRRPLTGATGGPYGVYYGMPANSGTHGIYNVLLDNRTGHIDPGVRSFNAGGASSYDVLAPRSQSGQLIWSWTNDTSLGTTIFGAVNPNRMTPVIYPSSFPSNFFYGVTTFGESAFEVIAPSPYLIQYVVTVDVTHL